MLAAEHEALADVLTAHGVATTGQGAPEAVRALIGTLLRQRADATVLLGAVLHRFRMVPSTHAGVQGPSAAYRLVYIPAAGEQGSGGLVGRETSGVGLVVRRARAPG